MNTKDKQEEVKYPNIKEYKTLTDIYTVESDEYGYIHYKKNGLSHNTNGPAIIYRSGAVKYYTDGIENCNNTSKDSNTLFKKLYDCIARIFR